MFLRQCHLFKCFRVNSLASANVPLQFHVSPLYVIRGEPPAGLLWHCCPEDAPRCCRYADLHERTRAHATLSVALPILDSGDSPCGPQVFDMPCVWTQWWCAGKASQPAADHGGYIASPRPCGSLLVEIELLGLEGINFWIDHFGKTRSAPACSLLAFACAVRGRSAPWPTIFPPRGTHHPSSPLIVVGIDRGRPGCCVNPTVSEHGIVLRCCRQLCRVLHLLSFLM